MRTICNLVVLVLGITLSACASADPPPACSSGLTPTFTVPPKLPPRLHNEFSGKAQFFLSLAPPGMCSHQPLSQRSGTLPVVAPAGRLDTTRPFFSPSLNGATRADNMPAAIRFP
jgi:hypothetical protein